jgi:4-oxalocrotonate tautomerase
MPIIDVTLFEGREEETKLQLMREVTEVVARRLEVPPAVVTVVLREIPRTNLTKGGSTISPGDD